jgi:hypothetical protein
MHKRFFLLFAFLILTYSCWNYNEMVSITRNVPQEYNGIDTIIRIDGYYYNLCGEKFCRPFILSNQGYYIGMLARFHSHDDIISDFYELYSTKKRGNYHITNDTITVNDTSKYGPWSYDIIQYVFVILDETTLERVYYSYTRVDDTTVNTDKVKYEFYPYDIEKFK